MRLSPKLPKGFRVGLRFRSEPCCSIYTDLADPDGDACQLCGVGVDLDAEHYTWEPTIGKPCGELITSAPKVVSYSRSFSTSRLGKGLGKGMEGCQQGE